MSEKIEIEDQEVDKLIAAQQALIDTLVQVPEQSIKMYARELQDSLNDFIQRNHESRNSNA